MSVQNNLIGAACKDRDYFNSIKLHKEISWNTQSKKIWDTIDEYYSRDPSCDHIDLKTLRELVKVKYPKDELIQDYQITNGVSVPNLLHLIREAAMSSRRDEILKLLQEDRIDQAEEKIRYYSDAVSVEAEDIELLNSVSVDDVAVAFEKDNLIPIAPRYLCDAIGGGVPPGTQVGIVARPDVGKTVAAINQAVIACYSGRKTLYISNEDPTATLLVRFLTRFNKQPKEWVLENRQEAFDNAMKHGYDNLYFKALTPGSVKEIEALVEKVRPEVLIVDQVRNLHVYNSQGITDVLTRAPIRLRDLAKKYNMVNFIVTQAGDSGHNKLALDVTDVEYSNTGFSAQLDLMIGMGQNPDLRSQNYVKFNFPKNKLSEPVQASEFQIRYDINWIG